MKSDAHAAVRPALLATLIFSTGPAFDRTSQDLHRTWHSRVFECAEAQAHPPVGVFEKRRRERSFRYRYQRQVAEAACVDPEHDDEASRKRKIGAMWQQFQNKELVCNSLQFDVVNGSVLKYALSSHFDAFVHDAIAWGIDLNTVDPSDGRTALDYVKAHMDRSSSTETRQSWQRYYEAMRKAGARHGSEL